MSFTDTSNSQIIGEAMAPLPYLPTEVKLRIFHHLLPLPDGIYSTRWDIFNRMRVKPYLVPGLAPLVTETLYRRRKVVLEPCTPHGNSAMSIIYPKPTVNHWVDELEVRFSYIPEKYHDIQANWLKKLCTSEIGFQNLRLLRIVIRPHWWPYSDSSEARWKRSLFIEKILEIDNLRFRTKELELIIDDHTCVNACHGSGINADVCFQHTSLRNNITLHQDPIEEPATQSAEESPNEQVHGPDQEPDSELGSDPSNDATIDEPASDERPKKITRGKKRARSDVDGEATTLGSRSSVRQLRPLKRIKYN